MKIITSAQNSRFKDILKLANKQSYRRKYNLALLEGAHLAEEWLKTFGTPEICLIRSGGGQSKELTELVKKCEQIGADILGLSENLFNKISPVEHSLGIIFIVKIPGPKLINPLADTVILENIQDPGNLGTILRSAAASGVEQIICSNDTVGAWSPKVLRAAMGAHFRLNIHENQDLTVVCSELKVPIYATSLDAKKSIYDKDLKPASAWVFGNEGAGVSESLQDLATEKVIIPQVSDVESLNVAMAATICLFEQNRQRIK